jgi:hypothetical protein
MSDERDKDGQPQGFKVSDRRKRYEEPAADAPAPAPPESASEPPRQAAQPAAEPAAGPSDLDLGPDQELNEPGAGAGGVPGPADFLQLIGKLYQEGLAFMGLFDDPKTGQSMANFPIASWHIDILGVLEEKTKGNLSEEEAKLIKEAIANLKVTFVRASGYIKH